MRMIRAFLHRERTVLCAYAVSVITLFAISTLMALPFDAVRLITEIQGFILIFYLFASARFARREENWRVQAESSERELAELRQRIEQSNEALRLYFMTWMHQIKTPITVSKLILTRQEDEHTPVLQEQMLYIEEYTGMALSYLKLMEHDTDMDIAPVSLDQIIRPILKKNAILFINRRITLVYETIPNQIITDGRWFGILLEQLISNALKYTPKGQITIAYDAANRKLTVADTGIGIRSEDLPKIFDRGYSGFNGRLNEKSSGIGLYLAKHIAQRLNLKLEVTSVLGGGSQFSIVFEPNLTIL